MADDTDYYIAEMSSLREEIRFLTASAMTTERDALILFAALVSFYVGAEGYDDLKRTLIFIPFVSSVLGLLRVIYIIRSVQNIDDYLLTIENNAVGDEGGWVSYFRSLGGKAKMRTTLIIWPLMIVSSLYFILVELKVF